MISIAEKTLEDLEFHVILKTIQTLCITEIGKQKALNIIPYKEKYELMRALKQTSEYRSSYDNNNFIPNHYFETISTEIKMLGIEGSFLEASSFRKLLSITETISILIKFFGEFAEYYSELWKKSSEIEINLKIISFIDSIIDKYGQVKDSSSDELKQIRKEIQIVYKKINDSFVVALSECQSKGYLDEIKESFIQNKRVLAISSMYRRKVKGIVLGSSKTGSIVYIEPETTLRYSRELSSLEYEEKQELLRILKQLTNNLRPFLHLFVSYQEFLSDIDLISAKSKYALKINALLPEISEEKRLFFKDAFHPILYLNNKANNEVTYPQTIDLDESKRIIVISGPNAGGKTISLKTIGLLQLMLQSGILIPVHQQSSTFLFDRILTDIGDNQSIDNHLSTYSYRLKNMNYFLKKCTSKTLFLIDEFGTGSDPELGGALAEVFLEEFYQRESFGIITTHYSNLKILADELPFAINANMLFDKNSLAPLYNLVLGQAGSSFTFEVALKNGIAFNLINRAKKKIEGGKVRFDKIIASMQKERSAMEKNSHILKEEKQKVREEIKNTEKINKKIKDKLESYQELYDSNQKVIYLGNKIEGLAGRYFQTKNKKELISEFLKIIEIENSKRKKTSAEETESIKEKKNILTEEVSTKIDEIRQEKKAKKAAVIIQKERIILKVGDKVRMIDGKAVGSIHKIYKDKAEVNYGSFISKVNVDLLELI